MNGKELIDVGEAIEEMRESLAGRGLKLTLTGDWHFCVIAPSGNSLQLGVTDDFLEVETY